MFALSGGQQDMPLAQLVQMFGFGQTGYKM